MRMEGEKILYDCFLCQRPFQFGPHIYDGRHIPQWGIQVCRTCVDSNWDGLVPEMHPRLVKYLEEKGIAIRLNKAGWIDIPPPSTI